MPDTSTTMVRCELCNGEAFVYCGSDSAYLCWNCDARVHGANFLAARHVRRTINCSRCKSKPSDSACVCRSPFAAAATSSRHFRDMDAFSLHSSSSSSACVSSTDDTDHDDASSGFQDISTSNPDDPNISHPKPSFCTNNYSGILVDWCKELGAGAAVLPAVLIDQMARNASGIAIPDDTFSYRVGLAASLWFSLMRSRRRQPQRRTTSAWRDLKKLEEVSGVPAKLIVAAEIKLAKLLKVMRQRRQQRRAEEEEGWAEC